MSEKCGGPVKCCDWVKLENYAVSGQAHNSLCFGESYKLEVNHTGPILSEIQTVAIHEVNFPRGQFLPNKLSPFEVICNPPPKDLEQTSILYQCLPLHLQLAICNGQNQEDLIFWIYTKDGSAPLWLLGLVPGARLNKRALILSNCHNKYVATTDTRHSLRYANLQIMWTVAPFRCFCYYHPINRDSICSFVRRESMLYLA